MSAATVSPEVVTRTADSARVTRPIRRATGRPLYDLPTAHRAQACVVAAPAVADRTEPWLFAAVIGVVAMFLLALVVVVQGFWSVSATPQSEAPAQASSGH